MYFHNPFFFNFTSFPHLPPPPFFSASSFFLSFFIFHSKPPHKHKVNCLPLRNSCSRLSKTSQRLFYTSPFLYPSTLLSPPTDLLLDNLKMRSSSAPCLLLFTLTLLVLITLTTTAAPTTAPPSSSGSLAHQEDDSIERTRNCLADCDANCQVAYNNCFTQTGNPACKGIAHTINTNCVMQCN